MRIIQSIKAVFGKQLQSPLLVMATFQSNKYKSSKFYLLLALKNLLFLNFWYFSFQLSQTNRLYPDDLFFNFKLFFFIFMLQFALLVQHLNHEILNYKPYSIVIMVWHSANSLLTSAVNFIPTWHWFIST